MLVLSAGSAAFAATTADSTAATVNVNLPVSVPNLGTGALTVGLQGAVVGILAGVTGTNITSSYIMVDVNNQNVAGIDPFTFYSD